MLYMSNSFQNTLNTRCSWSCASYVQGQGFYPHSWLYDVSLPSYWDSILEDTSNHLLTDLCRAIIIISARNLDFFSVPNGF